MTSSADHLDALTRALLTAEADAGAADRLPDVLSEFCHVLRNRLNALKIGLYLAQRTQVDSTALEPLSRHYRELESFVESVQAISRPVRLTRVSVALGCVLKERRTAWTEALAARDQTLHWSAPRTDAPTMLDPTMLTHALDDLVAWRCAAGSAGAPVHLGWSSAGGQVNLSWEEPSLEGPQPPRDRPPGLALLSLARVAAAHGGRLELPDGESFRVRVCLPLAGGSRPVEPATSAGRAAGAMASALPPLSRSAT